MLTVIAAGIGSLSATTCVADKRFKVKRICGVVVDTQMSDMPGATVQIVDEVKNVVKAEVKSGVSGSFGFEGLAPDRYILRVRNSGFWEAWQPIELTTQNAKKCNKPIKVVMSPAGGCSYVQRHIK